MHSFPKYFHILAALKLWHLDEQHQHPCELIRHADS